VAVPLAGRFTLSAMFPATGPAVQVPPPAPTQDQSQVRLAGKVSATEAPVAVAGPAFAATIVYVTVIPGTAKAVPSVLVIDRSAIGLTVVVSVALLLAPLVSVVPPAALTVAVFESVPEAVPLTVALTV
jgi:hypothetical protein